MTGEKIFDSEILKDEQLDNVAGGTWNDVLSDLDKFLEFGKDLYCRDYGMISADRKSESAYNLSEAFKSYGVKLKFEPYETNKYFIDGKEVSRDEAWAHVESQIKK